MPKKTNRRIVIQTYQLRQAGLSLTSIMDRLLHEFRDETPNESTVSRWCRKFKTDPPVGFEEDVPFSWGTMTEVPWEQSREILDAWAWYITAEDKHFGIFTRRTAKWVWRVLQALSLGSPSTDKDSEPFRWQELEIGVHPSPTDVTHIAREYAWREIASIVMHERFVTHDLDVWLALQPWKSNESLERYHGVADGVKEQLCVNWHLTDLDWLEKVVPDFGTRHRARLADLLERCGFDVDLLERFPLKPDPDISGKPRTDGLLPSQFNQSSIFLLGKIAASASRRMNPADRKRFYAEGLSLPHWGTTGDMIADSNLIGERMPWYIPYLNDPPIERYLESSKAEIASEAEGGH